MREKQNEMSSWMKWIVNIAVTLAVLFASGILVHVMTKVEANAVEIVKMKITQTEIQSRQELQYEHIKENLNDIKQELEKLSNKIDSL